MHRALSWTIAATVGLLVTFVVAGFLALGSPGVERKSELTVADLFELLKLAFAVAAGLGAVVALVMAYRRQRVAEAANELAEAANRLAEATQEHRRRIDEATQQHQERIAADARHDASERRITELYTKAADQLGNPTAPVRLAGLYALERLAQGNADLRQTVVNVLCAYLRMPWTPADPAAAEPPAAGGEERVVRLTAQRLLAAHLRPASGDGFWSGIELDLTGATLIELDFRGVRAGRADFGDATFHGASRFTDAEFDRQAKFPQARFLGRVDFARATFGGSATFARADFHDEVVADGATFVRRCSLLGARFRAPAAFSGSTFRLNAAMDLAVFEANVFFSRVTFGRASFGRVTFGGEASFTGAEFTDTASFGGSEFQIVSFNDATFRGHAGFRLVTFLGEATFIGATFHEGANFERARLGPAATLDGATIYRLDQHYERTWPDGWRIHEEADGRGVPVRFAPEGPPAAVQPDPSPPTRPDKPPTRPDKEDT